MTTLERRAPQVVAPERIAPLATLPLFHKLDGRKAVVAGDSDGAVWKAELLAAAGAHVLALAPNCPERFAALVERPPAGRVTVQPREWAPQDLSGAAIAIGDFEEEWEARSFAARARRAGALVNIIDKPDYCDAQFGSIVNRSPLLVAISTDGAAPVLGQAIRTRIEALLPRTLTAWAKAAKAWRPLVQARDLGAASRRRIWERFARDALAATREPNAHDRARLLASLDEESAQPAGGSVTLVGAGPGDPDLLTLKAVRALQSADVILYDDLVDARVLELARREARRILVGKTGHAPSCRQHDINAAIVTHARDGARVVRLKSGDPSIFGRATEEIEACRAADIRCDIIPGVTAAQGAAASLALSLTERLEARRLQFVTGHGADGKLPRDVNWHAIADARATTVLYMPRKTIDEFVATAAGAGLSLDTPALAIVDATRPGERFAAGRLFELPRLMESLAAQGPALVLIGAVARRAAPASAPAHDVFLRSATIERERAHA